MTGKQMLAECLQWTKVTSQTKQLVALRKAYRWCAQRVYNTENGPKLVSTYGEELTALASITRTLDIESLLAHELMGFQKLWVKLPADTRFVPMEPLDASDQQFTQLDDEPAADVSLQVAQGHPVFVDITNWGQARFAPALPVGAVIRVDYYRLPREIDETDSGHSDSGDEEPVAGDDLPAVFDECITSKAIALLFNMIDDDREGTWNQTALDEYYEAVYSTKRTPGPTKTKPFRRVRRRYL